MESNSGSHWRGEGYAPAPRITHRVSAELSLNGQQEDSLANDAKANPIGEIEPGAPPKTASLLGAGDDDLRFSPIGAAFRGTSC